MSIKLMSQIWEHAEQGGSELLVLLALADYANDDGTSIYPSIPTLAKKARLSVDQARRVIHKLIADGVVELVEAGGWVNGRNRSNEYRILQVPPLQDASTGTRADARGGTRAHASTVPAPMQEDPSYNHHKETPLPIEDDDKAQARGTVFKAWTDNIPGTMTPIIGDKLNDLIDECTAPSVIHGIITGVEAGARNFKYIAACARNHANGVEPQTKAAPAHRNKPKQEQRKVGYSQFNNYELQPTYKGEA